MISKNYILTAAFLFLLIISLWVTMELTHHTVLTAPSSDRVTAFSDNVVYTQYNESGLQEARITAGSSEHFQSGRSIFQSPAGSFYTQKRIPWFIRANQGQSFSASQRISLQGKVIMHQLQQPEHPETLIRTEEAVLYPKTQTAQTNLAVTIDQPGKRVKGVGMSANLDTGEITIFSESESDYQPSTVSHHFSHE
jgi:LPS export ABC transporter protein LptC